MRGPKSYSSIEDFEREEIRPSMKVGFSLDDLFAEAHPERRRDDSEQGPAELDFDF